MSKQVEFYLIRALTNMHVGSGDNNYGVVDNLVQRDVNTNLPTIHSSGLKGALKEFFKYENESVKPIFGDEKNAGKWQFLSGDMLSRPVRSDKAPYFSATSPYILKALIDRLEKLNLEVDEGLRKLSEVEVNENTPVVIDAENDNAIIEEMDWQAKYLPQKYDLQWVKEVFGYYLVLLHHNDLKQLDLPVIARNYLENGESKNLWYEEVVPYDSRFGTFIIRTDEHYLEFNAGLAKNVQIGANASIGYGLCQFVNTKEILNPEEV